jgi:hypothetical protein
MTNQGSTHRRVTLMCSLQNASVGVARRSDRSRQLTPTDDRHSVPAVLSAHNALRLGDGGR